MLARLLEHLDRQQKAENLDYCIVVADNDSQQSARSTVEKFAPRSGLAVTYCSELQRNIALVRNKAIECSKTDFIAFIDDDEFPVDDWLVRLFEICAKYNCAGVLGPVCPHFEEPPPKWILKGRFCDRPAHPTGTIMKGDECRTGNVIFRRGILPEGVPPFDPQFATGGEDKDFFIRMTKRGNIFVWCNEAIAYETVPPSRWRRTYMLKRALLRGKQNLMIPTGRQKLILTSILAVPIYALLLPVTLLMGHHRFMQFSVRFCDHLGRLLALIGFNVIRERMSE